MGYPAEVLLAALALVLGAAIVAVLFLRRAGLTKRNLARLDFCGYLLAAGGFLSLVPESVRMFAPNLMRDDPAVWRVVDDFKYLSFFLVSVSIGLGATRRWYSIDIEK